MITPEEKSELFAEFRAEMEKQALEEKENRNTYVRICKELDAEFRAFDYTFISPVCQRENVVRWKVREAIGTLLKVIYRAPTVAKLPAEQETEIKEFMSAVLSMMRNAQRKAGICEGREIYNSNQTEREAET